MRGRLLSYWSRQALVEAAAEVYPPCSSSRGPPHVRVALPNQVGGWRFLLCWWFYGGGLRLQQTAVLFHVLQSMLGTVLWHTACWADVEVLLPMGWRLSYLQSLYLCLSPTCKHATYVLLSCQVEVEVLVPFGWPCSSSEALQLVELACPQLQPTAAAALVDSINSNSALLQGGDLLGLLRAAAEAAEAALLDAEAASL